MKILIISPCSTHPHKEGNRQRVLNLAQALINRGHDVHFALAPSSFIWPGDINQTREYWNDRLHTLFPADHWTFGLRLLRKLSQLTNPVLRRLRRLPTETPKVDGVDTSYLDWWDTQLMLLDIKHSFDAVMVEYVFLSRSLDNFSHEVLKVIDTHDIFIDRDKKTNNNLRTQSTWLSTTKEQEAAGLNRANIVLGIQHEETKLLNELVPGKVVTVGHLFPEKPELPNDAIQSEVNYVTFVGAPGDVNQDAMEWFISEVWPLVHKALPNIVRLRIVGGVSDHFSANDLATFGIDLVGRVNDLGKEYASAAIVINPVRFGTGLAIKSIEALAYGKPLVCSPTGARGLTIDVSEPSSPSYRVAYDSKEYADIIVDLIVDEEKREELGRAAYQFFKDWNRTYLDQLDRIFPILLTSSQSIQ